METQGLLPACPALVWAPGMLQPRDLQGPALDYLLLLDGETEAMPEGGSSQRFPCIRKEQGSFLSLEGCTPPL